ncbi:tetratricopeptide repeat protein [Sphingobacteriales bacterium UPWRP_1]|nr:hypothetical protein B6N25_01950 [Sphingobacteriales bacterium TSM_CSS]PSJ75320.1 tetratricopeptide repeat protein [Sphingobacteriales bacterium UPWRP_1]
MNNMGKSIAAFSLLLLLLTGAMEKAEAQNKKGNDKKGKKTGATQSKSENAEAQKAQKLFFDGIVANLKGDAEGAIQAFKLCLTLQPKHDAAMYELARIFYDSHDKEQTLLYAENAAKTDPANKWYQSLYAETLSVNNRFEEAAKVYERVVSLYPSDYDFYFDWAYMLIQANKYAEAIKVYDALELRTGPLEDVSIQKQKLYIRIGQFDKAVAELQKLSNAFPNEVRYQLTLAELYQANNMPDKAQEVYNKLMETAPDNPYANLALADYLQTKGETAQAFEKLKKAFADPELPLATKAQRLSPMVEQKAANPADKDRIFELVKLVTDTHTTEALAHIIYGDLLNTYDQKEEALQQFTQASQIDGSSYEVWHQMLVINYELKHFDKLASVSTQVIELFPNQPYPYYFNGIACNELKTYDKAIKSLKQGTLISADNQNLSAQMYSLLGSIYNETKDFEKSDNSFEKALKITPNDPYILNNYSYFLSLRNFNLERAAQMAEKANQLEPNNSSFEDTYAWVLYKQKKYADARLWIEKAISRNTDNSATLLEHYGDILFQLNEPDKAVENWKKAKEKNGGSEFLDKKIKDRKLYE